MNHAYMKIKLKSLPRNNDKWNLEAYIKTTKSIAEAPIA